MPFNEREIQEWGILPRIYQRYLKSLSQGPGYMETKTVTRHVELLLLPAAARLGLINDLSARLKTFEIDHRRTKEPRVKTAWDALEGFIDFNRGILEKHDVTLFVYGSMQYGDPVNMDFDGLFITQKRNKKFRYLYKNNLSPELEYLFTRVVPGRGDGSSYFSLEDLAARQQQINRGNEKYVVKYREFIEAEFTEASVLLTGFPVYSPGNRAVLFKNRVWDMLGESPLLAAEVIIGLEETVQNREKRRSR